MDSPVYKLEKVDRAKAQDEMQDFEGPLDLILFLLGKNKLEIQNISIALICDQYLQWLEARKQMDLEVASEFVAMASHLIYLKTRMLLSIEDEEAKGEMDALIVQDPYAIGYLGVRYAVALAGGEQAPAQPVHTTVATADRTNMFDKDMQKLLFRF